MIGYIPQWHTDLEQVQKRLSPTNSNSGTHSRFTCPCRDKTDHNWNRLLSSWLDWTIVSQWLDQQLVRTYMVLLQLISHLINRYIPSNWLSVKRKFASTEKSFQVSSLLELEAQTWSKIFSGDYVTGGTFLWYR